MSVVWEILLFTVTTLETGLGFAFYHMLTGKKYDVRWKWVVEGVGVLVVTTIWFLNRRIVSASGFEVFPNALCCYIIFLVLGNREHIATLGIMLIYMITEEIFVALYGLLLVFALGREKYFQEIHFQETTVWRILIDLTVFLTILSIYEILKRLKKVLDIHKLKWKICLFALIEWWIMLWALVQSLFQDESRILWTVSILLLWIIFMIAFFKMYTNYMVTKYDNQLKKMQNELLEKNYNEIKELTQNNMIVFHDWKNHLILLKRYAKEGDIGKIRRYLEEAGESFQLLNKYIWSKNQTINLIVNTKCFEAEKKEIQMSIEVEDVLPKEMKDYDICSILTNLIDNAIEACEKVPTEKRWIRIVIHRKANMVVIKIENSMPKTSIENSQVYKSTKIGNHGYGLKSVQNAVEKYRGIMKCVSENEVFRVIISFFEGEIYNGEE